MAMRGLTTMLGLAYGLLSLAGAADVSVRTYNAPGHTDADTHLAIRRGLAEARHQRREDLKGNVTFDRSWDGAVLLKYGASQSVETGNGNASASVSAGVEITCTTCYVKGIASAGLHIADNFDAGKALNKTVASVFTTVDNFTQEVEDYFEDYFKGVARNLDDGVDWHDFAFPPLNYSFDMDIKPIDDVTLNFMFDDLELYLELNTVLGAGATYELNLFTSNTPIGIGVGKDLTLGVVFKVDLLLSVQGEIDISSGLHIKLDNGVGIDIALFSDAVSNVVFNGGQFEFLPVTIEKAGVVLSAILRIGIHSGIEVAAPGTPDVTIFNTTFGTPAVKGGIEVGVYANLAEFTTNVTVAPDDADCEIHVLQEYQIALGAVAGASIVFDTDTWGPVAATSIPIWTTALAEVCAHKPTRPATITASPTATSKPAQKRADENASETVTTKTKITHTGVQCQTSVIGNCPNSLQQTTQTVETRTLTTVVPSGADVTWPPTPGVADKVTKTQDFGDKALAFSSTSGSPVSYTAPPSPTASATDGKGDDGASKASAIVNGKTGGVSNKVIIGASVGGGLLVIAAIVGAVIFLRRRRAYKAVPAPDFAPPTFVAEPYARVGSRAGETRRGDGTFSTSYVTQSLPSLPPRIGSTYLQT
ncbi:uncharacterized protein CC84DRAFT_1182523 [Paraphaeosphaeria sporulosa]|uniref:Mid2 domain-containing protein n=1 Tax=Paraphaeosphaeria sporulosa TaxID=1460663 RepID=A0A177CXL3_9PLEO|nr:uncharacterized protein CC84DRAFT_1182523 [Paraphaeosphaeria sporulosa]OAG11590.1 hypothetical protein CC84DRAFT_1182523 [Paraphaeosphaeria sporulosa]